MSLTTHVFKVGNGNFVVSHSNGVMVINDAGYGGNHPDNILGSEERPAPLMAAFRRLLHENKIHTVHTVISHQDKDHYNLLEPLFNEIHEEQQSRSRNNPLNIGRVVIGGDRFINQSARNLHDRLINIANMVGPITAEFVGHGTNNTTVTKYQYPGYGNHNPSPQETVLLQGGNGNSTINNFRRIYFKNRQATGDKPEKAEYLKLFYPENMDEITPTPGRFLGPNLQAPQREPNNSNDTNLVGMLVSKKGPKGARTKQKGLLWGDASAHLQQQLPQINTKDVVWTIPPHHLSATDNQAVMATDIAAGGNDWSELSIVASTARSAIKIPPQFGGTRTYKDQKYDPGPRNPMDLYLTRDIGNDEVITAVTKPDYIKIYPENFNDMTRSFKSPIPRSPKIENLAAELAKIDERAIHSTSRYRLERGARKMDNNNMWYKP